MQKELNKLLNMLTDELDSPAMMGLASLIADLDIEGVTDVIRRPDEHEYMKRLVLLAVALGTEERCREEIDKIYAANENRYFHYYNTTGIGKIKAFDKFSITTSEYIKKCYGIIISEEFSKEEKGISLHIQRLIKKGYKPAFNFNMHKKWNMLEEFLLWYKERVGGVDKMSGIYLDRSFYVLLYLAYKEGKILVPTEMFEVMDDHYHYLLQSPTLEEITTGEEEKTAGYERLIEKTTFKNQKTTDVSYVFENIRLIEETKLLEETEGLNSYGEINDMIKTMPLTRIANAVTIIMETFGLSGDLLRESKLSNKQLEEIAKYIYIIKDKNDLTERESDIVFLVSLMIYAIASEYNNLRKDYYEGLKVKIQEKEEEEAIKEAEIKDKHQMEVSILQEKLRAANESISNLKEIQKNNEKTNKQLEVENKRISVEIEKTKENDKELQFLREFYFNSQMENQPLPEDENMNRILDYLNDVRGVIVGGHTNLTKKLKEKLPSFDFVAEEETSRNISFIKNRDIVFISSVHDNHGLFRKVMKEVGNTDVELTYLEKYQNVDLLLRDIYEKTKSKLVLK